MYAQVHIIVEGLVQGVGFRWFVKHEAESRGLSGFTRNLYDGTVEILASGDQGMLHELIKTVKIGPRSAHVARLKIDWLPPSADSTKGDSKGFEIH